MLHQFIKIVVTGLTLLACACSQVPRSTRDQNPVTTPAPQVASDVESCKNSIEYVFDKQVPAIDAARIELLLWNVFKEQRERWKDDWRLLAEGKHLVLLQEAVHSSPSTTTTTALTHWAFAPGYHTGSTLTGVATGSQVPPVVECRLKNTEPWLRTPKASLITQYQLVGSKERLLVANVHSINFSIGVAAFAKQLKQIKHVLAAHNGPIILAGDFNTWNPRRMAILERLATRLRLKPAQFRVDRRRTVFNRPVSHIYTRGLKLNDSVTLPVMTSDHNPIVAEFSVEL
ncbi:MAG: endonuclease/exonuclease/phosphatase family protein [Gammaproteobacteria bacterium]